MAQKVMYFYQSDNGSIIYNEDYEHMYNHENDLNISFDEIESIYNLVGIELIEIADFGDLPSQIRQTLSDVGDADYEFGEDEDEDDEFDYEDDEFDFDDL